jgi:glutamyl-tRNA synthetase
MDGHRPIITRFAPSPTGFLHIGGARTALFNYLYAKKYGGRFILRIEDTDTARNSEDAAAAILTSLEWLGLNWDDGPFYQSRRADIYLKYARRLLCEKKAYRCFCSPERLEAMRAEKQDDKGGFRAYDRRCLGICEAEAERREASGEKFAIRFKIPARQSVSFKDIVHGEVKFQTDTLEDFVIIKSDKMPAYNFSAAIDDFEMNISHVIRGDDHISNTPKQLLIFEALGAAPPEYGHVPMILGADKTKLSKRHGAVSLSYYEQAGFIKEAAVNYLALLGWAYDDKTEFFTIKDLIDKFSPDKFGRTPAVFDIKKLEYFNQAHLKAMDAQVKAGLVYGYAKQFMPDFTMDAQYDNIDYFKSVVDILADRLKLCGDIKNYAQFMFIDEIKYPGELIAKISADIGAQRAAEALAAMADIFSAAEDYSPAGLEALLRGAEIQNLNFSKRVFLLRSSLTAQTISPGIFEVINVLKRERCCQRIKKLSEVLVTN